MVSSGYSLIAFVSNCAQERHQNDVCLVKTYFRVSFAAEPLHLYFIKDKRLLTQQEEHPKHSLDVNNTWDRHIITDTLSIYTILQQDLEIHKHW